MKKPYREVKICKKGSKKAFLWTFVCFFCFAFVLFLSFFVSPILNIAKIATTNTHLYEKSYYFVILDTQTTNKSDAKKEAQNIKARGGAGVLMFDKSYKIFVSCYQNKNDAEKICASLKTEEHFYFVQEHKICVNTKNFGDDEQSRFLNYLNYFESKIQDIYNIANNLEKDETSQISVNLKIKNIKFETQSVCQNLLNENNKQFETLKNAFLSFESSLEYASDSQNLEAGIVPYFSVLREMMCHSILAFCEI